MGFHDLKLFWGELAGFEQNFVWNAHLANVVQGGRAKKGINELNVQHVRKLRIFRQLAGNGTHVMLGAAHVIRRLRLTCLCQIGQSHDGDVLDGHQLAGALGYFFFQVQGLVAQRIVGGF